MLNQILNYTFTDDHILTKALTHSTYAYEQLGDRLQSNERLEFFGDAVLQLMVTEYLYMSYPDLPEGRLSKIRSTVVCEPTLALIASEWSLENFLVLGLGEKQCGGGYNASNLANAVEAIIGAIYIDSNFEMTKNVVLPWLLPYIDASHSGELTYDYKSRLLEWAQSEPNVYIDFQILEQTGTSHDPVFKTGVFCNGQLQAEGEGHSKKESQQRASAEFLKKLNSSELKQVCSNLVDTECKTSAP